MSRQRFPLEIRNKRRVRHMVSRVEALEPRWLLTAAAPVADGPGGIQQLEFAGFDNAALAQQYSWQTKSDRYTFAERIAVDVAPPEIDGWTPVAPGIVQWTLEIRSDQALSLNLGFDQYFMPEGGQLRIYSPSATGESQVQTFTALDNESHGQLWTGLVTDDQLIVEVTLPSESVDELELHLASVNHGFRDHLTKSVKIGGGTSGACNIDVICSADTLPGIGASIDQYRDQISSVGAYTLGGSDTCSGALVNNTANDLTPYFLTAEHCGISSSNAASMVVYWNFECTTCRQPGSAASGGVADGRLDQFNSGAILRAEYAASDLTLAELDDPIDPTYGVFFAGWDRSGANATTAVGIHHPAVAEKRISFEFDTTTKDNTHVYVNDWDAGTTERGSSGSPLFDQNGRIIGQLTGGLAACGNDEYDYYGRFSVSWNGGGTSASRLSDWLDPMGTGAVTLNGKFQADSTGRVEFDRSQYQPGQSAQITVFDSDLSGSTIFVELSSASGDLESIALNQVSTGVYRATIGITENTATAGNGQLEGSVGDSLTVTYVDADDGQGGTNVPVTAMALFDLGSVSGVLWHDRNLNQQNEAGEPRLSGRTVYADLNDDGTFQPTEPSSVTNAQGEYQLNVATGVYPIRVEGLPQWEQTYPTASSRLTEVEPNNTLSGSQVIDPAQFSTTLDDTIENSTVWPHVTVEATGNNSYDYYQFEIDAAGTRAVFDIDQATLDTEVFLFNRSTGALLAENDDSGTADPGDGGLYESRLTHTFASAGTYVIGVAAYDSFGQTGGISGDRIPSGTEYELHISLDLPPNSSLAAARNIDDQLWSTTNDAEIEASTTRPHTTLESPGTAAFHYYRFTVPSAGDVGTFDIDSASFNSELFLFDSSGNLLASNDNDGNDPGSSSANDARIEHMFVAGGEYIIGVAAFDSTASTGGISGTPVPFNANYSLHVSLDNHPLYSNPLALAPTADLTETATVEGIDFGLVQVAEETGASVAGRHVFYNGASFDGHDSALNAGDDSAIASDKLPLLPGQQGGFENYTTTPAGLTGLMVDLANAPDMALLDLASDFQFRMGNSHDPGQWNAAPTPTGFEVRAGAGVGGSDRISFAWNPGTIVGRWIEVVTIATERTGLTTDDVFYFGNAPGDTGNSTVDTDVNAADFQAVRGNATNFLNPAPIDDRYDHNRDGRVNAIDLLIVRDYATTIAGSLELITAPANVTKQQGFIIAEQGSDSSEGESAIEKALPSINVANTFDDDVIDRLLASMAADVERYQTLHETDDLWGDASTDDALDSAINELFCVE